MNAHRYEVDVKPLSDELGDGWSAIVPELPGCKSDGDTPADALANAYDAIECWIEAAAEMGRAVPEPRAVRAARRDVGALLVLCPRNSCPRNLVSREFGASA